MKSLRTNKNETTLKSEFNFFPINFLSDPRSKPLYMVEQYTELNGAGEVIIDRGKTVVFDGFMTALYERELNHIIPDASLYLDLEVQGNCKIRLYHRSQSGELIEYSTKKHLSEKPAESEKIRLNFNVIGTESHIGRWYFSIEALEIENQKNTNNSILLNQEYRNSWNDLESEKNLNEVILKQAAWGIYNVKAQKVRPCFVICTFKREKQLARNVKQLISTLKDQYPEYGIIIVDNAESVTRPPDWPENVKLIHQRNVGGAGGFGRGIFEALENENFTHITMLDDDADVETTAIIRMVNLFSISLDTKTFIGGAQLDVYDPVKLADGGAYWVPDRFERPFARLSPSDLGKVESKDALMNNQSINFNGWWLFGGHVDGFREFGMPLPCFVHLDDVEYGVRLTMQGGRILCVPGIAVWHEPYYAKPEGWFAYYNIRNELIRVACHTHMLYSLMLKGNFQQHREEVEKRITNLMQKIKRHLSKRFNAFIKNYHYGSAILLVKAIEDFLKGPDILTKTDAACLHQDVMNTFKNFNINYKFSSDLPLGLIAIKPQSSAALITMPWVSKKNIAHTASTKIYSMYQKITHNGNILLSQNKSPLKSLSAKNRYIVIFNNRDDINWRQVPAGKDWGYYDPQKIGYHLYSSNPDLYKKAHTRFKLAIQCYVDNVSKMHSDWSKEYKNLISESFWRDLIKTFN